jgi:hypothetical protein
MGKPKKPRKDEGFVLYDVIYRDGVKSSRRKVALADLDDDDADARALTLIMDQDRAIAEKSGNPRGPIATITRSAGQ